VDQNGKVIFGVTPVKLAGFGVIARWDSRNDVEDPDSGIFAEIDWLNRNKALGGNYDFNTTSIDLRGFFPILDTSRMRPVRYAGQILVTGMDGDPPFQSLAQLGGRDRLRGYFLGRYRERKMVLVQNEIRIPLSERWGTVIYAAAGNVGHNWQQISRTQAKPAWGAGGRYRIANNQRVNIRLDFAWTRESNIPSYYLSLAEAF
jgi:outer membrane protein assembly factor BamA